MYSDSPLSKEKRAAEDAAIEWLAKQPAFSFSSHYGARHQELTRDSASSSRGAWPVALPTSFRPRPPVVLMQATCNTNGRCFFALPSRETDALTARGTVFYGAQHEEAHASTAVEKTDDSLAPVKSGQVVPAASTTSEVAPSSIRPLHVTPGAEATQARRPQPPAITPPFISSSSFRTIKSHSDASSIVVGPSTPATAAASLPPGVKAPSAASPVVTRPMEAEATAASDKAVINTPDPTSLTSVPASSSPASAQMAEMQKALPAKQPQQPLTPAPANSRPIRGAIKSFFKNLLGGSSKVLPEK